MKVAIINIGDELLNGRTQDLNAYWLGKFLKTKGIKLSCAHTVQDSPKNMKDAFLEFFDNYDVVITTGGVGPTLDDKTKECLATTFDKKLLFNQACKDNVIKHYERYGKDWNELKKDTNQKGPAQNYEYCPEDFTPIYNPLGLAPGFLYINENKIFASCPGVPREFQDMFSQEIFPVIEKQFALTKKSVDQFIVRTREVPEEKIFYTIDKDLWKSLERFGSVSSLPYKLGVDIIVTSSENGFSEDDKSKISNIFNESPISESIWQIGNLSLEEFIVKKALEKKITFGFAESCTGGHLASLITDISGCSKVFYGGFVSYDNSIKTNVLGVLEKDIECHGAVSEIVAQQMAKGAREKLNVDIIISTSGIAGPNGGTKDKPVGLVAIGYSTKSGSSSELFKYRGTRSELKERFSRKALYTLLDQINLV